MRTQKIKSACVLALLMATLIPATSFAQSTQKPRDPSHCDLNLLSASEIARIRAFIESEISDPELNAEFYHLIYQKLLSQSAKESASSSVAASQDHLVRSSFFRFAEISTVSEKWAAALKQDHPADSIRVFAREMSQLNESAKKSQDRDQFFRFLGSLNVTASQREDFVYWLNAFSSDLHPELTTRYLNDWIHQGTLSASHARVFSLLQQDVKWAAQEYLDSYNRFLDHKVVAETAEQFLAQEQAVSRASKESYQKSMDVALATNGTGLEFRTFVKLTQRLKSMERMQRWSGWLVGEGSGLLSGMDVGLIATGVANLGVFGAALSGHWGLGTGVLASIGTTLVGGMSPVLASVAAERVALALGRSKVITRFVEDSETVQQMSLAQLSEIHEALGKVSEHLYLFGYNFGSKVRPLQAQIQKRIEYLRGVRAEALSD